LNTRKHIEDTIRSVRSQTYKNIEYIVIDGGSTDGTTELLQRHDKEIDYWVSEKDRGISDAFNKGLRASTGDIVGFLNSEDYYINDNVIQSIVDVFHSNPEAGVIYGKTYYIPENSSDIVGVMGEVFTPEKMKKRNIMPHQSVFTKREVFERFGLFKLEYKFAMDYEYFLRATRFYRPLFIDDGLAVMRLGGISDIKKFAVCTELFKAQIANNISWLSSLMTLLYHYFTSAGLKFLRFFHIYTLGHLYKKLGLKSKF